MVITPIVIKVAKIKHLVDVPTFGRKVHKRSVPTIGGVAIFAAFVFSFNFWGNFYTASDLMEANVSFSRYFICSLLILFFVGLKDDIIGFNSLKKLFAQVLAGCLVIALTNARIISMDGLFGVYELPFLLSFSLSLFAFIVIVNSVNLIDGVDGLASGIGFLASVIFGFWFCSAGNYYLATISFCLSGALLGFFIFNFSPARVFMGDSGSLVIGYVLAVLALKCINHPLYENIDVLANYSTAVLTMTLLAYPLLDTIRVFSIRISSGKSPFHPDKNHIHHKLLQNGFPHAQTTLLLLAFQIILLVLYYFTGNIAPTYSFVIMLISASVLAFILTKIKSKAK